MIRSADLRGAARLAVQATTGVTDLVEAMHERIARLPGVKAPATAGRTGGITGLVYRAVRGVTRGVGGSLEALLALLPQTLSDDLPSAEREAVVAALNGVLGDHLEATGNPLATAMTFWREGRIVESLPGGQRCLLLLLHGLCMNDLQWCREGHDHGQALHRDLGHAPLYLRYNSGRAVADNGRGLALRLQSLLDGADRPPERFVLLCHSMGGLVARSALHHGAAAGHSWPARVSDMVFLGTPHHGAPLERAGAGLDLILGTIPYAAPFARLTRLRSAGITDLRHGTLLDEAQRPLALAAGPRCFAIAASLGPDESGPKGLQGLKGRLFGDGLVPVDSALGRHADPRRRLRFAEDRQCIAHGVGHMALLNNPEVYTRLRQWLR